MRKKILSMVVAGTAAIGLILTAHTPAHAQMFAYTVTSTATATSTNAPSTASSTGTVATSTTTATATTIVTTGAPVLAPPLGNGSEYLQLNGLVVTGVSSASAVDGSSQLFAANPAYPIANGMDIFVFSPGASIGVTCQEFASNNAATGVDTYCPIPAMASGTANVNAGSSSTTPYYSPYTILIDPATQLLLSDRSPATLAEITSGDTINVYGYYDAMTGTIDAEVLRDVSKPVGTSAIENGTPTVASVEAEIAQLQALLTQLEISVTSTMSTTAN